MFKNGPKCSFSKNHCESKGDGDKFYCTTKNSGKNLRLLRLDIRRLFNLISTSKNEYLVLNKY